MTTALTDDIRFGAADVVMLYLTDVRGVRVGSLTAVGPS